MRKGQRKLVFRAWDKVKKVMYTNPSNGVVGGMNDFFSFVLSVLPHKYLSGYNSKLDWLQSRQNRKSYILIPYTNIHGL